MESGSGGRASGECGRLRKVDDHSFYLIFKILHNQFGEPGKGCIVPTLRMDIQEQLIRKESGGCCADNLMGVMEIEGLHCIQAGCGYLVADGEVMAIPATAGVGEIKHMVVVDVGIHLIPRSQIKEREMIPQGEVVVH